MQRFDDTWKPARRRSFSSEISPLVVVNGIIVLALLVLAFSSPSAPQWIAAAAQAEFVGSDGPAMASTQTAQPAAATKVVSAN